MEIVSKRELNHHTAQVLDRVTPDNPVTISDRGRPRWTISAYSEPLTGLDALERAGLVQRPIGSPPPWPPMQAPTRTSEELDAILEELKGDY